MFQRVELHNHTTHSDGSLTPAQLAEYAAAQNFGVLALTDHNTVSGHEALRAAIAQKNLPLSLLPGVEITTFYGHILALGLTQMVDFSMLDPDRPEAFFRQLHAAGARAVGIAHPYCIGRPIMAGCRMSLDIHDWSAVDYLEVFNTSIEESPMGISPFAEAFGGNTQALALWQDLVLHGYRLAAVTGKDIHRIPQQADVFVSYAELEPGDTAPLSEQVIGAVLRQKTIVTKGPLLSTRLCGGCVRVSYDAANRPQDCLLELRAGSAPAQWVKTDLQTPVEIALPEHFSGAVVKLYRSARTAGLDDLLAVGAPVFEGSVQ